MKRFTKMLATSAITLSTLASSVAPAAACDRGGRGGFRGGFSAPIRSYSRPAYSSYSQPRYAQPQYSQPQYVQPQYSQPGFAQPQTSQPGFAQSVPQQAPQPVRQQAPQPVRQQAPQQGQQGQQGQQRIAQQPQPQQQPQQPQQQQPAASGSTARQNALQMLIGTPAEPASSSQPSADTSMPQFQPAPAQPATHVGTWKATLPNSASISLNLQNDGSFTWSARNQKGQTSQFQGKFQVNNGALTLIRQDNQQLSGSLTMSGSNAFTFKLNNAKDNGLNFQRS